MSNDNEPIGREPPVWQQKEKISTKLWVPMHPRIRNDNVHSIDQRKQCRDFVWGICTKGALCKFRHELDVKSMKDILKFCHDYQNNTGCTRPDCTYLHLSREEENLFLTTGQIPRILAKRYLAISTVNENLYMRHCLVQAPVLSPPSVPSSAASQLSLQEPQVPKLPPPPPPPSTSIALPVRNIPPIFSAPPPLNTPTMFSVTQPPSLPAFDARMSQSKFHHEPSVESMKNIRKLCHDVQNKTGFTKPECTYLHMSREEEDLVLTTGQIPRSLAERCAGMSTAPINFYLSENQVQALSAPITPLLAPPPPPPPPPPSTSIAAPVRMTPPRFSAPPPLNTSTMPLTHPPSSLPAFDTSMPQRKFRHETRVESRKDFRKMCHDVQNKTGFTKPEFTYLHMSREEEILLMTTGQKPRALVDRNAAISTVDENLYVSQCLVQAPVPPPPSLLSSTVSQSPLSAPITPLLAPPPPPPPPPPSTSIAAPLRMTPRRFSAPPRLNTSTMLSVTHPPSYLPAFDTSMPQRKFRHETSVESRKDIRKICHDVQNKTGFTKPEFTYLHMSREEENLFMTTRQTPRALAERNAAISTVDENLYASQCLVQAPLPPPPSLLSSTVSQSPLSAPITPLLAPPPPPPPPPPSTSIAAPVRMTPPRFSAPPPLNTSTLFSVTPQPSSLPAFDASMPQSKFRHEFDIESMKDTLKFCHDYQNRTGCTRPNCKYLHSSREEENLFLTTGQIPRKIAERYAGISTVEENLNVSQCLVQAPLRPPPSPLCSAASQSPLSAPLASLLAQPPPPPPLLPPSTSIAASVRMTPPKFSAAPPLNTPTSSRTTTTSKQQTTSMPQRNFRHESRVESMKKFYHDYLNRTDGTRRDCTYLHISREKENLLLTTDKMPRQLAERYAAMSSAQRNLFVKEYLLQGPPPPLPPSFAASQSLPALVAPLLALQAPPPPPPPPSTSTVAPVRMTPPQFSAPSGFKIPTIQLKKGTTNKNCAMKRPAGPSDAGPSKAMKNECNKVVDCSECENCIQWKLRFELFRQKILKECEGEYECCSDEESAENVSVC